MQLFYAPDINSERYTFNEEESKHAVKVLRLKKGDHIHITNGKGILFKTEVTDPSPKKCSVRILEKTKAFEDKGFRIHIAIAPTKNTKRFEWFLEKCTEIGIDEITPLICEHSERKAIRKERHEKVLIAAMKQSVKAYLPTLHDPVEFNHFISNAEEEFKAIAISDKSQKDHLKKLCVGMKNILVLIGPEGDFSTDEVEGAISNGFKRVSLGKSRLRTETAGVVACNIVNTMND